MTRNTYHLTFKKRKIFTVLSNLMNNDIISSNLVKGVENSMKAKIPTINDVETGEYLLADSKKYCAELFNSIDNEIQLKVKEKKIKSICKKGCTDCCSSYFYVSRAEFELIKGFIREKPIETESIVNQATNIKHILEKSLPTELIKLNKRFNLYSGFDDNSVPDGLVTCPFLSKSGDCTVYAVRPLICRCYGVTFDFEPICGKFEKIKRRIEKQKTSYDKYLVQTTPIADLLAKLDSVRIGDQVHIRRPFPLFYWILKFGL